MSAPPKKSASPAVFMHLTESAISIMLKLERQQTKDSDFKPVLQVTDIQLLSNSSNSSERYLVTLSDGTHTHNGMLATGRNDLVRSQLLRKGSVVQVSLFFSTVIQNRRLLIIIDLDLLLEKCDLIGDPKPLVLKVNKGNASSSLKAKESNLPLPNSVFSEITETMTDVFKEKLAKKEASFRRAYEIEKKAREAAEKKLIEEQKANRQLRKELESIKTHSPAQSKYRNVETIMDVTSPPTFIETSRPGIFKESENFAESEVVNRLPTPPPPVAEEPPEKKERVKLVVRRKKTAPLRKCLHCEVTETAQWRAGPLGPGTLCNACGVCFKRGRLYPEYRPAASPTFVPEVHSNSHKEVLQMRGTTPKKQKTG